MWSIIVISGKIKKKKAKTGLNPRPLQVAIPCCRGLELQIPDFLAQI